jgi:tetratricopeptide (TPR) repeat protein
LTTSIKIARSLLAAVMVLLIGHAVGLRAQSKSRPKQGTQDAKVTAEQNAAFDNAGKLADDARTTGRFDDAIQHYNEAVRIRPQWSDGWWYLGAIYYKKELYQQARDAFSKLVAIEPKRGPAWAMLGLCQYQTRELENSVTSLQRVYSLGLNGNKELESVVRYHSALLYLHFEQFEFAFEVLKDLPSTNNSPKVVEAFGLIMLRLPLLPHEVPVDIREKVRLAGQAGFNMAARRIDEARQTFKDLVARYPDDANVHYSFGVFMMHQDVDIALKEFYRALELNPKHQPAMVQIAFEHLKRRDYDTALPLAEKSVELMPKMFAARNLLGRVLLELGQTARAISELEIGVRLAPESSEMHFALARAYARAGRKQDAEKENEIFKKLQDKYNQQSDASNTGNGTSSSATTAKPNPQ